MAAPNDEAQTVRPAGLLGNVEADPATRDDAILHQDAEACRAARDAHDKHLSTLRAKFAMRGYELHIVSDGFYITRWGMGRTARTLTDLEAFAAQVGAV
jgi:hypothetical protein